MMMMENPNLSTYSNQLFLSHIKKKYSLSSFLLCEAAVPPKEYRYMYAFVILEVVLMFYSRGFLQPKQK